MNCDAMCALDGIAHCRAARDDFRSWIQSLEAGTQLTGFDMRSTRQIGDTLHDGHVPRRGLDDLREHRAKLRARELVR